MINLLPPEGRKNAVREYRARIASIWGILLTAVVVATVLLLVPSYVHLSLQLRAIASEVDRHGVSHERFKAVEAAIRDANDIAKQLAGAHVSVEGGEIIGAINAATPPGVSVNAFSLIRDEQTVSALTIQGVAVSRSALAEFKTALERSPLFVSAEIPISDLARSADLPFALTVVVDPLAESTANYAH